MENDRLWKSAEWFLNRIFGEESIRQRHPVPEEKLPSMLRTARSLEDTPDHRWQSRESVFLKQAKLLANYEDDYPFRKDITRYYPTYQSLDDRELRGYFSWRTKVRKGDLQQTCLSFAFLYIYELLNQVGVENPLDGYRKLVSFRDGYGAIDKGILPYLRGWLTDYVVYYGLDAGLLADSPLVTYGRSIAVLESMSEKSEAEIMDAVKQLAPKWLARSKFYGENRADCDRVIVSVLRRISDHHALRCKKTMTEHYFGRPATYPVRLFDAAVFCDPLKLRSRECVLGPNLVYSCKNGLWSVTRYPSSTNGCRKLEDLLKTIDAVMREEYSYKHPIRYETETKWLIKGIREDIHALQEEKKAAEAKKITIDYSQLAKIRREAAITQEKLTVEEEEPEEAAPIQETAPEVPSQAVSESPAEDCPLSGPEYRLLHCLLYDKSTAWVQAEGHMLSVLVDSVNETLYDTFLDSVLDDTPALIDDYIEDLKEMVVL